MMLILSKRRVLAVGTVSRRSGMEGAGYIFVLFAGLLSAVQARPNILIIIADDLGWSDVGFHSGDVRTPNIDALAYNGVILNRHYSQPLCTPSRSALLTGDYPIRHGMQGEPCLPGVSDGLPLDLKLMPEYFRELGYKTHLVGKWHLGYETEAHLPTRRGFDTFFGYLNGFLSYWDGTHFYEEIAGRDIRRGEDGIWGEVYGRYLTEVLTEEAVELIQGHDTSESLLMVLAQAAVHTTLLGIEKDAPAFVHNDTERGILREMAYWMDWSVGEVVSALDKKGILNNTIIIFISDNGAPTKGGTFDNYGSNWPFRGQKASPHEGGVRAVGLIYSQLLPLQPRVTDQMFHITDWFPTLYTAAGGNVKDLKSKDGIDQWSSLVSGTAGPRDELLVDIDEVQGTEAYISGRWKLIKNHDPETKGSQRDLYTGVSPYWMEYDVEAVRNSSVGRALGRLPANWAELRAAAKVTGGCGGDGEVEAVSVDCHSRYCLFDLETDPSECRDLAGGNHTQVVAKLRSRLDFYRTVLVPQTPKIYNRQADPHRHDDYWAPWMVGSSS